MMSGGRTIRHVRKAAGIDEAGFKNLRALVWVYAEDGRVPQTVLIETIGPAIVA